MSGRDQCEYVVVGHGDLSGSMMPERVVRFTSAAMARKWLNDVQILYRGEFIDGHTLRVIDGSGESYLYCSVHGARVDPSR